MEEVSIYEIYALKELITMNNLGYPEFGNYKSIGFYCDLETAKQAVRDNWFDISDKGANKAAAIVKKKPGLYPIALLQGYYIFNNVTEHYDETEMEQIE